jgi:hypothetical protein
MDLRGYGDRMAPAAAMIQDLADRARARSSSR